MFHNGSYANGVCSVVHRGLDGHAVGVHEVRREEAAELGCLALQVPDQQMNPQFGEGGRARPRGRRRAHSPRMVKCLPSSASGRGITCTEISSPTVLAVSAPASIAA